MQSLFANATRPLLIVAIFMSLLVSSSSLSWARTDNRYLSAPQEQAAEVQPASTVIKSIGTDVEVDRAASMPARIDLATEFASAIVTDHVASNEMVHYLVRGVPGQRLRVTLDAVPAVAGFALHGVEDRQAYHSLQTDVVSAAGDNRLTQEWSGILPKDQEYLLSISSGKEAADFMLSLELFDTSDFLQLVPAEIMIPQGKQAGMVSGTVSAETQHRYQLNAEAGQIINLELKSDDPSVTFGIYGIDDGRTYKWLYDHAPVWSFVVPQEQGYLLLVANDEAPADYSLVVTLP